MVSATYKDADKYTAGGAELDAMPANLSIEWQSGSVEIACHDEERVAFSESCARTLDEESSLHYFLDGDTLYIKFASSGYRSLGSLNKHLTLYLPEDLYLQTLETAAVSASIDINGCGAEEGFFNSVSGRITVKDGSFGDKLTLNSTSGKVELETAAPLNELRADTVSGSIAIDIEGARSCRMESVSGRLSFRAAAAPDEARFSSTSGKVELYLPAGSSFTLEADSVSGSFNSELPLRSENGRYIYGGGEGEYEISTTSGNIAIMLNE